MSVQPAESDKAISRSELTPPLQTMFNSQAIEIIDWNEQVLRGGSTGAAVTRLTGTLRLDGHEHSWSLIRKKFLAPANEPADPSADSLLSSQAYWQREGLLYQSGLLDHLPPGVAAAKAYHVAEEPDGYSLWTEELHNEIGSTWPLAHYGVAAYHFAQMHAPYLDGQPLPTYPWLTRNIYRQREHHIVSRDKINEMRQDPLGRRVWPDDVTEGILRIWQEREHFFKVLQQQPQLFQHGDCGRKNLFARIEKTRIFETVAVDWGMAGIGALGEELTCIVGTSALWFSAPASQLAELDEIVFDGYLQGLRNAGWRGDPRQVRLGYTAAFALRFSLLPIGDASGLTPQGRGFVEELFGHSIEEVTDNGVLVRRFTIQRADEARQLMALLP